MISEEEMNERLKYRTDLSETEISKLWVALKEKYPEMHEKIRNIGHINDEDEQYRWIANLNSFLNEYYFYTNCKYYKTRSEVAGDMMSFAYKYLRDEASGDKFND